MTHTWDVERDGISVTWPWVKFIEEIQIGTESEQGTAGRDEYRLAQGPRPKEICRCGKGERPL